MDFLPRAREKGEVPPLRRRKLTPEERRVGFEQEISEARGGFHPYISTSAAAWYLKMHPSTLSKLVSKGLAPPSVVRDGSRNANAKRFYQLHDLESWLALRTALTWGERQSLVQLDAMMREERQLRAQTRLSKVRASTRKLKKLLPPTK